jgi:segregation and condensation protein A
MNTPSAGGPSGPSAAPGALGLLPSAAEQAANAEIFAPVPQQQEMPLAMVRGQPMLQMPQDLYIPPDALEVILEAFEGPLDLLLYLIRRQNLDILDIPIAEITRQYVEYIELMHEMRLELAADYLVMAAMLAEIKSRLLLPRPPLEEGVEEDPRAELVRRLIEYEQMKLAAARLDALPVIGRDFLRAQVTMEQSNVTVFPDVSLADLREAWADILKRAKLNQHHHISREQLSVREYMTKMLRRLQGVRYVEFQEMFDTATSPTVMVVTFIAMLELSRERLLEVTQAEAFAPIYVRLAYTPLQ